MEELFSELIMMVKDAAPELWAIAQRQVLVNIIQLSLWTLIAGTLTTITSWLDYHLIVRHDTLDDYDQDDNAWYIGFDTVALICCAIAFLLIVTSLISNIVNPDYHAIKALLNLVKQ